MKNTTESMAIPWEHLLYLIAIQHGATVINVVTVSTLENLSRKQPRLTNDKMRAELVVSFPRGIFNASQHFGCVGDVEGPHTTSKIYKLCEQPPASIQTTVECTGNDLIANCDKHSPGATLEHGTFLAGQFRSTLFLRGAFWTMPFFYINDRPIRVRMMWGMVVQRLLWLSGKRIFVRDCDILPQLHTENRMYKHIADWLNKWSCAASNFLACLVPLIKQFSAFFALQDTLVFEKWISLLSLIKYEFPQKHARVQKCYTEPALITTAIRDKMPRANDRTAVNLFEAEKLYKDTCFNSGVVAKHFKIDITTLPHKQFTDVLLIIIFNEPLFDVIPYTDALYRPYFSHILYCGPGHLNVTQHPRMRSYAISFVSYGSTPYPLLPGALNYKCLSLAVDFGQRAFRGYLFMADDMVIGLPLMVNWNRDIIWTVSERGTKIADILTHHECEDGVNVCRGAKHRHFWSTYEKPLLAVLDTLQKSGLRRYVHNLARANDGYMRVNYAFADVFYIPAKHACDMAKMANVFHEHQIHLEIAIPTMIRSVNDRKLQMSGYNIPHGNARDRPWLVFNEQMLQQRRPYLHPTKWNYITKGHHNFTLLFCNSTLPYLYSPYNTIIKNNI